MSNAMWIDRNDYPFAARYFQTSAGRMHYVDEGSGSPIVMVHGTPTWSYLYRDLIRKLSRTHRVIAADNLGFGLSDKPEHWSGTPRDHAQNLELLIGHLGLRDITLVVHDFGGPIGLSYAVEHPEHVARLVLFNTWMWSLRGNSMIEKGSKLLGGKIGRFLYTRMNFSPRYLLKRFYGNTDKLTPEIHRHYLAPFGSPSERMGTWIFAKELIGSSDWFNQLWERRQRIEAIPALLLWGMNDPSFNRTALERWKGLFINATVVEFPDAGHVVQEESPEQAAAEVEKFIGSGRAPIMGNDI